MLAPPLGPLKPTSTLARTHNTRHSNDGIVPCRNKLRQEYRRVGEPNGEMETNLVKECDNTDVPDFDFRTCENNTYMCCWTENDGKGMADNTVRPRFLVYSCAY